MKGRAAVCGRGRCRHAYGEKTCGYYLQVIIRYYTEEKINEYGDGCLGAGSRASTCAEKGPAWVWALDVVYSVGRRAGPRIASGDRPSEGRARVR